MSSILYVIDLALGFYTFVLIAAAVLSWLIAFGVVNMRNEAVRAIANTAYQLTEPVLRPIRQILPNLGGVDVSPVIVLLIIAGIRHWLNSF